MVRLISSRSSGKQLTLQEEFVGTLLPRKGMTSQLQPGQNRLAEIPYSPKSPPDRVPAAVDWRGTGATGPVKDQATCGSCYAFGAVAAMQAALFMSTGGPMEPPLPCGHTALWHMHESI